MFHLVVGEGALSTVYDEIGQLAPVLHVFDGRCGVFLAAYTVGFDLV